MSHLAAFLFTTTATLDVLSISHEKMSQLLRTGQKEHLELPAISLFPSGSVSSPENPSTSTTFTPTPTYYDLSKRMWNAWVTCQSSYQQLTDPKLSKRRAIGPPLGSHGVGFVTFQGGLTQRS